MSGPWHLSVLVYVTGRDAVLFLSFPEQISQNIPKGWCFIEEKDTT